MGRLSSRREAFSTRSLVKEVDRRLRSGGKETVMRRPQACREQRGVVQGGPRGPSSQTQLRGATWNGGTAGTGGCLAQPCSALLFLPCGGGPIHSLWHVEMRAGLEPRWGGAWVQIQLLLAGRRAECKSPLPSGPCPRADQRSLSTLASTHEEFHGRHEPSGHSRSKSSP